MRAGRLKHRITLQAYEETRDPDTGAVITTWVDKGKISGAVEPLSAREFIAAGAVQSKVTTRITIRYRSDITAAMRILHRGKIYNIEGVLSDKDSGLEYLTLPCGEGVNEG